MCDLRYRFYDSSQHVEDRERAEEIPLRGVEFLDGMGARKIERGFRNQEYALTARGGQFRPITRRNFDRAAGGELFDNLIAHRPKVFEIHIVCGLDRRLKLGWRRFKSGLILDKFPCAVDTPGQDGKLLPLLVREALTVHPGFAKQKPVVAGIRTDRPRDLL